MTMKMFTKLRFRKNEETVAKNSEISIKKPNHMSPILMQLIKVYNKLKISENIGYYYRLGYQ